MKAVVVYESFWGNTAAVARAIAEGIGGGTQALTTSEAVGEAIKGVDLMVVGAPIHGFSLPREDARRSLGSQPGKKAPTEANPSLPSLRSWLDSLAAGQGRAAAFETGFRWSPGGATKGILRGLRRVGYIEAAKGRRFLVKGTYGPPREGQLEEARRWGADLAAGL